MFHIPYASPEFQARLVSHRGIGFSINLNANHSASSRCNKYTDVSTSFVICSKFSTYGRMLIQWNKEPLHLHIQILSFCKRSPQSADHIDLMRRRILSYVAYCKTDRCRTVNKQTYRYAAWRSQTQNRASATPCYSLQNSQDSAAYGKVC
jgi:hypothetical protein